MMLLGEVVATLRASTGWTLMELAERVRRAGASSVAHQSLQQLESKPNMRPRYIEELAKAFGKSVEDLRAWQPGMPTIGPNSQGIKEDRTAYEVPAQLTDDEDDVLSAYRASSVEVRNAVLVLLHASRRTRRHKPADHS